MQFKGLLYYSYVNIRYSLMIFWLILTGILILSYGGKVILGAEDTSVYFTFSIPIYIFAMMMGHWMIKNVLPYTLKMGSTRINVYLSYAFLFLMLSLFNAVVANTINSLLTKVTGEASQLMEFTISNNGETTVININHLADLVSANDWLHRVIIDTSVSFFFIAISFGIGLIFYRYRLLGGLSFLGALFLMFLIAASKGWIWDFVTSVYQDFSIAFFYQMFVVGLVIYVFTYLLLRRASV